jgi:hypothetical protein
MKASHMVDILEKIKRDAKENPDLPYLRAGICHAGACLLSVVSHKVFEADDFASWPKFSGRKAFPIPPTKKLYKDKGIDEGAYSQFMHCEGRGYWTGSYGKLRFQLLNHLIRRYKAYAALE